MDLKIVCHSKKQENPDPVELELEVQGDLTLGDVRKHLSNLNFMSLQKCKFKMPGETSAIDSNTAVSSINMSPLQLDCYTEGTNNRDRQTQSQLDALQNQSAQAPTVQMNGTSNAAPTGQTKHIEPIVIPVEAKPEHRQQEPEYQPIRKLQQTQPTNVQIGNDIRVEVQSVHIKQDPNAATTDSMKPNLSGNVQEQNQTSAVNLVPTHPPASPPAVVSPQLQKEVDKSCPCCSVM